jgi:carbamoyl-phosphate synthase large subunit
MKTILVSGASGVVGYGILRSLRKSGMSLRLIGTTIYEDSAAQGFCDIFEKAPPTNDSEYLTWLLSIIAQHRVDLIIPGIEADMYRWVESTGELEQCGSVKPMLNEPRLIALCRDKWVFFEALAKSGLPCVIDTTLDSDFDSLARRFGLPFLLKPRVGFGSKGIVTVDSLAAYLPHQVEVGSKLMAQPIMGTIDEEFSTAAFCDGRGGYYAHMTLRRKLSNDGFTDRAEVVTPDDDIAEAVRTLCGLFAPIGPTNFQFRRHQGVLKLLEINPRVSSATSIRAAFGYNECAMAVDYYLESKQPQQPVIRCGRAVRYMEDLVFYS